jgi:site-specific DNA-methyltransferase (adenine-specific)
MLELNKIYNGDCLGGLTKISDKSIDLIVTDPPYMINYKTGHRKDKTHKFCGEILNDSIDIDFIDKLTIELYRVLKDNSALYLFTSSKTIDIFKPIIEQYFKIKNLIIWVKNSWTAGDLVNQYGQQYEIIIYASKGLSPIIGKRLTDVWYFNRVVGNDLLHQNQKPEKLIQQIINKSSKETDIILDPFMGSGTTAIACMNTKRKYIGFELDKEYFDVAEKRIKEHKRIIRRSVI